MHKVIFKIYTKIEEGKGWLEFHKYVKGHKSNREDITAIKDVIGQLSTDPTEKANSLNLYYSSVFICERSTSQIQCTNSCEPFTISTKIIGRVAAMGKTNQ
jgi:hypothetical protein